jgi:hypothetical protein
LTSRRRGDRISAQLLPVPAHGEDELNADVLVIGGAAGVLLVMMI